MKVHKLNEMNNNISLNDIKKIKSDYFKILASITNFLKLENKILKSDIVTNISIIDEQIEITIEDNMSSTFDIKVFQSNETKDFIRYLNNPEEYMLSKKYNL